MQRGLSRSGSCVPLVPCACVSITVLALCIEGCTPSATPLDYLVRCCWLSSCVSEKKTAQAAKHSLHQLRKGDTLAQSAVSLPHQMCVSLQLCNSGRVCAHMAFCTGCHCWVSPHCEAQVCWVCGSPRLARVSVIDSSVLVSPLLAIWFSCDLLG